MHTNFSYLSGLVQIFGCQVKWNWNRAGSSASIHERSGNAVAVKVLPPSMTTRRRYREQRLGDEGNVIISTDERVHSGHARSYSESCPCAAGRRANPGIRRSTIADF